MRRMALLALALALPAAGTLSACGNERARPGRDLEPSKEIRDVEFESAGMTLGLPERGVLLRRARAPGVFRALLGQSVLAGFAYRRREELPSNQKELKEALDRLKSAAKERSSSLRISRARTTKVNGALALELLGRQTISGGVLRTRSLHVFKGKAEYVIELLASRRDFDRLDRTFFPLIRRTLEVTGRVKADRR